jgi:hypothetical protein
MKPAAWMTDPSWFLVVGLPWPETQAGVGVTEAAFAIAPAVTQAVRPVGPDSAPIPLGRDLTLMLEAGSRCAAALSRKVIFLSDITRWLADVGLDWESLGIDYPTAENELEQQSPGLLITVSSRAYTILCSTARNLTIHYTDGSMSEVTPDERELLKANLEARLDADWPAYITKALASAQPAA